MSPTPQVTSNALYFIVNAELMRALYTFYPPHCHRSLFDFLFFLHETLLHTSVGVSDEVRTVSESPDYEFSFVNPFQMPS